MRIVKLVCYECGHPLFVISQDNGKYNLCCMTCMVERGEASSHLEEMFHSMKLGDLVYTPLLDLESKVKEDKNNGKDIFEEDRN